MGHSEPATTARYSHLANDPVRQAADNVAVKIAEAMNQPAERKVINIESKRG